MRSFVFLTALAALTSACAGSSDALAPEADVSTARTIADDCGDAHIVLYLANTLDLATLDDAVGLDARAAANIVDYRLGADGLEGTADDEVFDDLDELDAVSYVGDAAMLDLLDYGIDELGMTGASVHGILEGSFEAKAMVYLANMLSEDALDDDVALDSRAAANLVTDRGLGFTSLADLDDVSYVSASAFGKLHDYAVAEGMLAGEGLVVRDGRAYATLQDAVDDATAVGITIELYDGVYTGTTVIDSTLIIRGQGQGRTVFDGQGVSQLFDIDGGDPCFYDLTVTGGLASNGGGAKISAGSTLFERVDFVANEATSWGGAIRVSSGTATLTLRDVRLVDNVAGSFGGAVDSDGALIADRVLIEGNTSQNGAVWVGTYATVRLTDVEVFHNVTKSTSAALLLGEYDTVASNIDFYANSGNDLRLGYTHYFDALGDDVSFSCGVGGCTYPDA